HAPDGSSHATVSVAPLRTPLTMGEGGATRAIVFVRERAAPVAVSPERVRAAFGLTPAEARVACDLLEGQSLSDISDARGIGRETLRTQLRNVFDKTGVRRQADLVKVLLNFQNSVISGSSAPPGDAGRASP